MKNTMPAGPGACGESWEKLQAMYPEASTCTNAEQVFALLESKMRKFRDYAEIPCEDNGEDLVAIEQSAILKTRQIDPAMIAISGTNIFVRKTVATKLQGVAETITKITGLTTQVVYGYRDLAIQQILFSGIIAGILENGFEGTEANLFEEAHRSIAVPSVAGHPTGGAVDLLLCNSNEPLDMGTNVWDFTPNSYTFSPFIGDEAWQNRLLLRSVMEDEGFTPFDGEWWHFSYGDKEWAAANNEPCAIYDQVTFSPGMIQ